MSVKDKWKDTGKGIGKSIKGLGKSIVKTVKVGSERLLNEEPKDEEGNPVQKAIEPAENPEINPEPIEAPNSEATKNEE